MTPTTGTEQRQGQGVGRAVAVALIGCVLAATFVMFRVSAVGWDGFVAAGAVTADGSSVFTYDHYGYDGQFFYRLALEPFSTAERVDGIAFDAPAYRQQRIGYPLIAFSTAFLTPLSTVQSLVVVNVVAISLLIFQIARYTQSRGYPPYGALLILAWPAFIFSLGLDLSEIVALAFLLGALRKAENGRHSWAAVLLCGAVLTRETTILVALIALAHYRERIYGVVFGVFAAWQATVWLMWDAIPGITALPAPGERLLAFPLVGIVQAIPRWGIVDVAVATSLLVIAWIGFRSIRRGEILARVFVAYGVLALVLGRPVWESWRGFARATVEFVAVVLLMRLTITHHLPSAALDIEPAS